MIHLLSRTSSVVRPSIYLSCFNKRTFSKIRVPQNIRDKINFSRVPKIDSDHIIERTHRGSGPGGQAAAKTNYAVTLIHSPTNVVVRCEESRSVERNRARAHEKLLEAVDVFINKEDSVAAQVKRIEKFRKERTEANRKKKRDAKLNAALEQEEEKGETELNEGSSSSEIEGQNFVPKGEKENTREADKKGSE